MAFQAEAAPAAVRALQGQLTVVDSVRVRE